MRRNNERRKKCKEEVRRKTDTTRRKRSPVPGLVGAADPAALFGDDESEVHPQPAVSGTSMRPHMSSWLHD